MTRDLTSLTDAEIDAMSATELRQTLIEAEKQFQKLGERLVAKHPEVAPEVETIAAFVLRRQL